MTHNLTPKDEWIQGYAAALAVSHPELSARERFVKACQSYRDQESDATTPQKHPAD